MISVWCYKCYSYLPFKEYKRNHWTPFKSVVITSPFSLPTKVNEVKSEILWFELNPSSVVKTPEGWTVKEYKTRGNREKLPDLPNGFLIEGSEGMEHGQALERARTQLLSAYSTTGERVQGMTAEALHPEAETSPEERERQQVVDKAMKAFEQGEDPRKAVGENVYNDYASDIDAEINRASREENAKNVEERNKLQEEFKNLDCDTGFFTGI